MHTHEAILGVLKYFEILNQIPWEGGVNFFKYLYYAFLTLLEQ